MKQITIRLDDATYAKAVARAAALHKPLPGIVEDWLRQWTDSESGQNRRNRRLHELFRQADERDREKPGSAGPVERAEIYVDRLR